MAESPGTLASMLLPPIPLGAARSDSDLQYDAELLAMASMTDGDFERQLEGLRKQADRSMQDRRSSRLEQEDHTRRIRIMEQGSQQCSIDHALSAERVAEMEARLHKLESIVGDLRLDLQKALRAQGLAEARATECERRLEQLGTGVFGTLKPAVRSLLEDVVQLQQRAFDCVCMRQGLRELWQALRMTHGHLTRHLQPPPPVLPLPPVPPVMEQGMAPPAAKRARGAAPGHETSPAVASASPKVPPPPFGVFFTPSAPLPAPR